MDYNGTRMEYTTVPWIDNDNTRRTPCTTIMQHKYFYFMVNIHA